MTCGQTWERFSRKSVMIFLMLQVVICALVLGDLVFNNEKLKTVNMLANDLLGLFKNLEDVQNPVPALISTLVLADAIFMLSTIVMFKRVSACKLMVIKWRRVFSREDPCFPKFRLPNLNTDLIRPGVCRGFDLIRLWGLRGSIQRIWEYL